MAAGHVNRGLQAIVQIVINTRREFFAVFSCPSSSEMAVLLTILVGGSVDNLFGHGSRPRG
jgi:hypothetical protein